MKKRLNIIILFILAVTACQKNEIKDTAPAGNPVKDQLDPAEAKRWWESQGKKKDIKPENIPEGPANVIDWGNIQSGKADTGNYLFVKISGTPTFQKVKQGFKTILFTKNANGEINNYFLDIIPDAIQLQREQKITPATFTGRVFVYDKANKLLGGWIFLRGKRAGSIRPAANTGPSFPGTSGLKTKSVNVAENCEWVDSNYIGPDGVVVIYSEKICTYDLGDLSADTPGDLPPLGTAPPEYTGGGGGTGAAPPSVSNLPGEGKPKIDPKSYTNCFGNIPDAGASMKITVYVQEPFPGTTFNLGSNSVGHVAIGLSKTNGTQTITQVVGFYPNATGLDKMHAPSKLVDNGGFDYNASITYSVDAGNFNAVLNYIGNPPATYDLTDFNCTNFVISACKTGGITLPDATNTVGLSGPGGAMTAMTPAGLGNSIEKLNGNNVNNKGGNAPLSKGPCK